MTILGEALVAVGADMSKFSRDLQKGIEGAGGRLKSLGSSMTQTGSEFTRGLTVPLVGLGVAAFKTAADFEASMTQITALVGIPREQVQAWGGEVRDLAVTYGKSATEASEALYFITSAGVDAADSIGVLDIALKASASGLGDTQTIADALTSAMNAYESSNLTAAESADILTAAVKYGKLEATELAPVLGRLLPTSSALNISFADVAGTLAVMSRTGLDAAEASTSLSAIMSTLLKPTAQSAKLLEEAGLSMSALRAQATGPDGLIGVMRTLEGAFGDNDEALAQIVPNVRAFRGVMNVLAQDGATVADVMAGVNAATGSLDAAFAEVSQTAKFQFSQTMAIAKDLLVEIGNTVLPIATAALAQISGLLTKAKDAWAALNPETQKFIVYAAGAVAAIGPILLGLGTFTNLAGTALVGLSKLGAMFGPWGIAIALVVAGLAALTSGTIDVSGIADQIVGGITSVVDQLPTLIPQIVEGVMGIVTGIVEALPTIIAAAADIIVALAQGIAEALPMLLPVAVEAVLALVVGLVEALPLLITAGIDAVLALVEGVLEALPLLIDTVVEAIPVLITAIVDLIPKLVDAGIKLVLGLLNGVIKALPKVIQAVVGAIPVLLQGLITVIPALIDGGIKLVLGLVDGIVTAVPLLIEAVIDAIPVLIEAIIGAIPLILEGGVQLVVGLITGLVQAIPQLLESVVTLIALVAVELGRAVVVLWQKGGEWISGLWNGLVERWEAVMAWFGAIPGKIGEFFINAKNWLIDAGKNIMSGLLSGITSGFDKVKNYVKGIGLQIAAIKGPEEYDRQLLVPAGGWIMSGLEKGILSGLPSLRAALSEVTDTVNFAPSLSPTLSSSTGQVGRPIVVNGVNVQISITGAATTGEAKDAGTAAAEAFVRRLSEEVAAR